MAQKKILICIDWFSPGFRAGGPIKSIVNLANTITANFQLYIYTSDRDLGMQQPYPNIEVNTWVEYGNNIFVKYNAPANQTKQNLINTISALQPNTIYLNSIFSNHFSIQVLRVQKHFTNIKYVLAPRGMLRQSALAFKPFKKKLFLFVAKLIGLYKHTEFHATDAIEINDIQKQIAANAIVTQVSNCPALPIAEVKHIIKITNHINLLFIGRIHPIKNLHLVLHCVQKLEGIIVLNIVGVLEDEAYWQECTKQINTLTANVTVNFLNEIEPTQLVAIIENNHLLILPTKGENFGHAIYESLALGRPVIISDQTPWRNLQQYNAGWDLPLSNQTEFVNALQTVINTNQQQYNNYCNGALTLATNFYNNSNLLQQYSELLA